MILISVVVVVIAVTLFFTLTIRAKDLPPPDPVSPTQHLEDRKAQIYENLRDLGFEYLVGKLSDDDYQETKLGLQKELAGVLGEIDKVGAGQVQAVPARALPEKLPANVCPRCKTQFPKPMKFCSECGKAMAQ
jgi:hypothetical protein